MVLVIIRRYCKVKSMLKEEVLAFKQRRFNKMKEMPESE
jgi:hypothetical protein